MHRVILSYFVWLYEFWNRCKLYCLELEHFVNYFAGNGLIDETEFLQWIGRIQALREDSTSLTQHDDLTQDLVAAFRLNLFCIILI